jgi:hypothetical protein
LRFQKLLIIVIILVSLIPAYYITQWLKAVIQPRSSFGRFLLYMLACLGLVFAYTFLLVALILKLFPVAK